MLVLPPEILKQAGIKLNFIKYGFSFVSLTKITSEGLNTLVVSVKIHTVCLVFCVVFFLLTVFLLSQGVKTVIYPVNI